MKTKEQTVVEEASEEVRSRTEEDNIGKQSGERRTIADVFFNYFERYMVWISIGSFIIGVVIAVLSKPFGNYINNLANKALDYYGYIAPLAIFVILAPSLAEVFSARKMGKFGIHVISWLAVKKVLACLWAAIFTCIVFGFTLLPEGTTSIVAATKDTLVAMKKVGAFNVYFVTIYISVAVALASIWIRNLQLGLRKTIDAVEVAGKFLEAMVPLFLISVGAYITTLSSHLQIGTHTGLHSLHFAGFSIDPSTTVGMISVYLVGSFIVFLGCLVWHSVLLFFAKVKVPQFSIGVYFKKYWICVYPLLFATSSEVIALPLNLYLTKKYIPWVRKIPRRLVVGMGSFLNINGTIICVYVFVGLVAKLVGVRLSFFEMLSILPVVFLISYAVPGIPGELVLFAGPILLILGLPPEITATFLALYVGLQLGLPDSVRTGNNSTDDLLCALLLNQYYIEKFEKGQQQEDFEIEDIEKSDLKIEKWQK